MSQSEFLYRPVLEDLTVVVDDRRYDPFEAYAHLVEQEQALGLLRRFYPSTSITSGGHRRDDSLNIVNIIKRNTDSAKYLADQLAVDGQIVAEQTLEPVMVGKIGHWTQGDYMDFMLSAIAGYTLTTGFLASDTDRLRHQVDDAYNRVELDRELMLSSQLPEERAPEYFKMAYAHAALIKGGRAADTNREVDRLIDTDESLGSKTETVFAKLIDMPVKSVSVVRTVSPDFIRYINPVLAEDTSRLISFGATVFDTEEGRVRLMLTDY